METALEVAELLFRVFGIVGVLTAVGFGIALWRHNRRVKAHNVEVERYNAKLAYLEDLSSWRPGVARAIQRHRLHATASGFYVFGDDLFWCPPALPGMTTSYYAVCWADLDGDDVVADVHEIYELNDPITTLRKSLPALGLGEAVNNPTTFPSQVWLMSPDTTRLPGVVRASAITNPADLVRYRLAVFGQSECVVWVHRIDVDAPEMKHR